MNEFENMVFLVLFDILFIIVILKYLNLVVELISLLFIGRDKVMIVLLLICFYVKFEINCLIDS